jgi:hypothetical protein
MISDTVYVSFARQINEGDLTLSNRQKWKGLFGLGNISKNL